MNIEKLKALIAGYEDDLLTRGELHARLFEIVMEDDIQQLKKGYGSGFGSTCCCRYPHNKEETYHWADLFIYPHGYSISPKGSMWQRIKMAIWKPKILHIRGGC